MADLLEMAAAAPRPMTIAHQGLAACLAAYSTQVIRFPADETLLAIMGDILPQAHGDGITAQALVTAAKLVLDVYSRADTDWRAWAQVDEKVAQAVKFYYRDRAAATHARIFPETQMQPSEAAHAAE